MRVLSSLLILAICGPLAARAASGDDLEALCQNQTINLGRMSEFESLHRQVEDGSAGECHQMTESAIRDFKRVIDENTYTECSIDSYNRFRRFYKIYLDTSVEQNMESFVRLPASLRRFMIGYGMKLSGLCRLNMVRTLLQDTFKAVEPEYFVAIEDLLDAEGPIAGALGYSGKKPDEMLLPSDLIDLASSSKEDETKDEDTSDEETSDVDTSEEEKLKLSLKAPTGPYIRNLKTLCERRFKPMYEPLMLPVARLANMGFQQRKALLKQEIEKAMKEDKTSDLIGKWTRIVFLCEMIGDIELYESESDRKQVGDNDAHLVTVRSKTFSKKKSSKKEKPPVDERDFLAKSIEEKDLVPIEPSDYEPNLSVEMPDEIVDKLGDKFAVMLHQTSLSEKAHIRLRFTTKILRQFRKHLKNRELKTLFKELKDLIKQARQAKKLAANGADARANFVNSLNQLIVSQLSGMGGGVSCGQCDQTPAPKPVVWGIIAVVAAFICLFTLYQLSSSAAAAAPFGG